jgi:hypothetical protein
MTDVLQMSKEELRLSIALLNDFQLMPTLGGVKLMRADPHHSPFLPSHNIEAPDWPNDSLEALRLLRQFNGADDEVNLHRAHGGWTCDLTIQGQAIHASGETFALAVSRAYLMAKQALE